MGRHDARIIFDPRLYRNMVSQTRNTGPGDAKLDFKGVQDVQVTAARVRSEIEQR